MRRVVDMTLAALSLILLLPLMLVAVVGIWISDPGPALFRAVRVGRNGRRFTMHKFRTMRRAPGPRITAGQDPRIFGWGYFLRSTKIDELPQLLDILRGHMAIIGPRPEDPVIAEAIADARWTELLAYRPGLVSPGALLVYRIEHRDDCGDPEQFYLDRVLPRKIALDLAFLRQRSWRRDVGILWATARMVAGKGRCG